ncbi:MAG: alpha/beta fold hydrolase [Roseburia sp.]
MIAEKYYNSGEITLKYYEIQNDLQPLVLLHAQGVDGTSFANVMKPLSKKYHVYAVDYFGHGGSTHDASKYNVVDIGNAVIDFVNEEIKTKVFLLGHSSGGLIAAYIASKTDLCRCLILEDPPFFSSQGERRRKTFNYIDLSTVCHHFNNQTESSDFVLYYFCNQYAWNFFPEKSREKLKKKMTDMAAKYRAKHPDKNLKVMFWPKAALSGFQGMNHYDPKFGETFYDDSFHRGIPHEDILKDIKCRTIFMKARTNINEDGILMAALSEADLEKVSQLVSDFQVVRFACGHGIHVEKTKEFIACLMKL